MDVRSPPLTTSAPHPDSTTDSIDASEDLAPLNLSTKNSGERLSSTSEAEQSDSADVPLNLSLRPLPHCSPGTGPEDGRRSHELSEDPCDQRQTAALALCQLATARSLKSLHPVSSEAEAPEAQEEEEAAAGKAAKSKTKANTAAVKRASDSRAEKNGNKLSKRARSSGRPLRRRPRCS